MRTGQVIPIVVGSLESVTKNLDKWLEKLDKKISISLLIITITKLSNLIGYQLP